MILSGNGDFEIPGKDVNVSLSQDLSRADISGNTSGTDFVTKGNKAKEISVTLVLPMIQKDDLKRLLKVAEAIDDGTGEPVVYVVSDELCLASNIREVFFEGRLNVSKAPNLRAWNISFSLKEFRSPAEKREAREQAEEITGKRADGKVIEANPANSMLQNAQTVAKQTVEA